MISITVFDVMMTFSYHMHLHTSWQLELIQYIVACSTT